MHVWIIYVWIMYVCVSVSMYVRVDIYSEVWRQHTACLGCQSAGQEGALEGGVLLLGNEAVLVRIVGKGSVLNGRLSEPVADGHALRKANTIHYLSVPVVRAVDVSLRCQKNSFSPLTKGHS